MASSNSRWNGWLGLDRIDSVIVGQRRQRLGRQGADGIVLNHICEVFLAVLQARRLMTIEAGALSVRVLIRCQSGSLKMLLAPHNQPGQTRSARPWLRRRLRGPGMDRS